MKSTIGNILELRSEIARLKGLETEQKAALAARFHGPAAIIQSVKSLFPGSGDKGAATFFHPDMLNLASRFLLPLALNKTLFKHSNFVVKALVGLVSQKAAGLVSKVSVENLQEKGKALFSHFFHQEETGKT